MSDGKFNYLPSQSPLHKKTPKTKPAMTLPANSKKKTKSPYSALMEKVKTVKSKSKATAIRKSKKQKTNNSGAEFLQSMPSTTATVHGRLGILSANAVPARHGPIITALPQPRQE